MGKCIFCGGAVLKDTVTFIYDEDNEYFLVEHVPAEVCSKCGERTYSPDVTDRILDFAKHKSKPVKTIEIPVFDLAGKV
jgi:YgiT-type zinc finger domain-containing protein